TPARRPRPRVAPVATVAAGGVAAVEIVPTVRLDEVKELVRDLHLPAAEAADGVVDVPDEDALTGQVAVGADPHPVLEEGVLVRTVRRRGDLHDARDLFDRWQLDAARGRRDRVDVGPAEADLRPRARVRRPLAPTDPGSLPHEPPDPDPLLRHSARRVQL